VIALWKDPVRGVREIPLEPDAHGVLVSASADRATRRSSDGRRPVQNGSEFFDVSVYQVHAASTGSGRQKPPASPPSQPLLEVKELTILIAWAEALAEALAFAPERVEPFPPKRMQALCGERSLGSRARPLGWIKL
jgi:hypothetical protein